MINTFLKKVIVAYFLILTLVSGANGQPGEALEFDGSNDYVEASHDASLNQANFTLETWFKANSSQSNKIGVMINRQENSSKPWHTRNYWLVIDAGHNFSGSGPGAVSFRTGDGSNVNFTLSSDNSNNKDYRDGQWHHVAVVVNDNNGSAEMFVDGVSVESVTFSSGSVWTGTAPLRLGSSNNGSGTRRFKGTLDETRLWSDTRSKQEIQKLIYQEINNTNNYPNLEAYYDFNNPGNTTLTDIAGSNKGTLKNMNVSQDWVSSDAILTDNSNTKITGTHSNNVGAIWPSNTNASSGGLALSPSNSFSSGEDMVFGHNGKTSENTSNNSNYNSSGSYSGPTTVESRLNREWHIDDNGGNKQVDFTFTTDKAGTGGFSSKNSASDYVLIKVVSSGQDKIIKSANSASPSQNTIQFNNVDINSTYTLGTTNESGSALPVELINFKVRNDHKKVSLNWRTASETNNSHFLIQRKTRDDWKRLGKVNGSGTTMEPQAYQFYDPNPQQGINYYRLKQVDFDGSYEYSNIKSVKVNGKDFRSISLFPVPASDILNVNFSTGISKNMQVLIRNTEGQVVYRKSILFRKGETTHTFPISSISQGTYFIHIQSANKQHKAKFIKQN